MVKLDTLAYGKIFKYAVVCSFIINMLQNIVNAIYSYKN